MAKYAMFRPDRLTAAAAAFGLCAVSQAQAAASLQMMGNIGDANKASGLIRHYTLDGSARTIDAVAAVPNGGVSEEIIRKVTVETAHDICADPRGRWLDAAGLPARSAGADSDVPVPLERRAFILNHPAYLYLSKCIGFIRKPRRAFRSDALDQSIDTFGRWPKVNGTSNDDGFAFGLITGSTTSLAEADGVREMKAAAVALAVAS